MSQYTVWQTGTTANATIQEALVKEDVSDLISNLFPLDTPLQQVLDRVPMTSTFTERPLDYHTNIRRSTADVAIATSKARPEGWTYTSSDALYPERLTSVAAIHGENFEVSRTDRTVQHYAIQDRFAYEALKKTQEVVNNFEMDFWWSPGTVRQGAVSSGGTYSPDEVIRQTQGIMHWVGKSGLQRSKVGLTTGGAFADGHGNDFGDTAGNEVLNNTMTWAYDAGGVALDPGLFKDRLMGEWWDLTGRSAGAVGFAGARVKSLFGKFSLSANGPINERSLSAASKTVVDTIDYYDTDFGLVSVNLCRYLNLTGSTTFAQSSGSVVANWDESLLFIQPKYFHIGVLRGVGYTPLSQVGDFDQGLVVGEQSLVCTNPQGGTAMFNCAG